MIANIVAGALILLGGALIGAILLHKREAPKAKAEEKLTDAQADLTDAQTELTAAQIAKTKADAAKTQAETAEIAANSALRIAQDLQKTVEKQGEILAAQGETIEQLEGFKTASRDYIHELRLHIENGYGPPPPDWPEIIKSIA